MSNMTDNIESTLREAIKEAASDAYNVAFNDAIDAVQRLLRECNPVSLSPLELASMLEMLKMKVK